ncbi:helix-turn-helix domain-containing protein [Ruminococcus sp. CAG:57]|jgi:DNA-binding Xre family transcriptional regulator|uniref:helix-turn-helix domain-containing protein n=1 Tax=Ruminococcus sp. CAG:57 TaxID=1262962 RepID=UPI0003374230|nr:helix-turn-helix transcriptional regulator [Ruminococcus sp. CAG:57]CDC66718.1 transcriptional regulator XRE family [Ruminococcus sp. CAG:57]
MNTKNYKIELKKIMHEKHISGKQLAELAEISEGEISKILTGKANPTIEVIARLVIVLKCDLSDLVKILK